MRRKIVRAAAELDQQLREFHRHRRPLPGIADDAHRAAFVATLIESVRRVQFAAGLRDRDISWSRADPTSDMFDPLKAAILKNQAGDNDEAFWLVFWAIHCGKHKQDGWRLARDLYGAMGGQAAWTWARTARNPAAFRDWLAAHEAILRGGDGVRRRFGNHRKYESLKVSSARGTAAVVESYVAWVSPHGSHGVLVRDAMNACRNDPRSTFRHLYRSMNAVRGFGRTARFDYLAMVGKLELARIEPDSTYMHGATGPFSGAKLLFGRNNAGDDYSRRELDRFLVELDAELQVGMQVLEDALCNWQKSPAQFKSFRG